jgi:T5SS/PEP-CTERM-associated repeat protein
MTNSLYVGGNESDFGGAGTLTVRQGGLVNINPGYMLQIWNPGVVNLSGGQISTGSFINSGGTFNHTDGILEVNGGLFNPRVTNYVLDGTYADDLPTVKLLNGGTENISGEITVGNVHKGQLEIRDGSQFTCTNAYIGRGTDSNGLVMVHGADPDDVPSRLSTNGPLYAGYLGKGDLDIKNGAVVESHGGAIACSATAAGSGVFIGGSMSGYGQWNLTDTLYIGGSEDGPGGQGTLWINLGFLNLSSGTVKVYPQGTLDIQGVVSAPLIELEGGTLTGDYLIYSSVISRNGVIDIDSGDYLEFRSGGLAIDNGYDLFKTGDGRLQLEHTMSWGARSQFHVMDGTTKFMLASCSVQPDASLIISELGMVYAEVEDPFTDNTNPNLHVDVLNDGYLQITNGVKQVGTLVGNGEINIQPGAEFHTDLIQQDVLTICAGAKVVIRPIIGGPLAGNFSTQPVPEPATWLLLLPAVWFFRRMRRK